MKGEEERLNEREINARGERDKENNKTTGTTNMGKGREKKMMGKNSI